MTHKIKHIYVTHNNKTTEIGHGFGLPHTDENPRNRDLGNCLDYTNTPENNLRPGEVNFARLRQIYLENPNANNEEGSNVNQLQQDGNVEVEEIEEVEQQGGAGNPRNNLRRIVVRHYLYVDDFYERN